MRSIRLGILFLSLVQAGCSTYANVAGDAFPTPLSVEPTGTSAGLEMDPASTEPPASSISKASVVELLADRLSKDHLFDPLIFPYSPLARAEPGVILDATVTIEEYQHMGENMAKAVFVGATFFLLAPVLPFHFGVVVDLRVVATSRQGEPIGTYAYRSAYDFHYRGLVPSETKMNEWLDVSKRHAVEQVTNLIKADREKFLPYSTAGRVSFWTTQSVATVDSPSIR